jgi:predicted alpha/beta hydrolase family esterase
MARRVLMLPGYGNSGPAHWQSRWEALHPNYVRVQQRDWEYPLCAAWVATLDAAVRDAGNEVVLVAHSLGCLTVAHWAAGADATTLARIAGALLVAPPDPSRADFPAQIQGFADVPLQALPFRSTVVMSCDDPYDPLQQAERFAQHWGSDLVRLDEGGHINSDSGLGEWPDGHALLAEL